MRRGVDIRQGDDREGDGKLPLRDVVRRTDLPITKGLQENIHAFRRLDQEIALQPILEQLALRPTLDLAYDDETEAMLPAMAGGLSVALANCFRIVYPDLKNPQTRHWAVALRVCDLLLQVAERAGRSLERQGSWCALLLILV